MRIRTSARFFVNRAVALHVIKGKKLLSFGIVVAILAGLSASVLVSQMAAAAPIGAIVNANGKCLDNRNNSSANQNPVQTYICNGGASQIWTLNSDGTVRINGKCLDTANHALPQGSKIVIATCGNFASQKWTWSSNGAGKLKQVANGQCLDIPNNSNANSVQLASFGCWNTNAQLWTMPKEAVPPTPPMVALTAPVANATVNGNAVTVSANASDVASVASVQFRVDGVNIGTPDTAAPYTMTWDTTAVADGTHSLTAVATNAASLSTTSAAVAVVVTNCPDPTSPSCQSAPVGDLPGWRQTFVDDFTIDAPLGSWAATEGDAIVYTGDHGGQWTVYPDGWSSTYTNGQPGYQPGQVLSVHNGQMDFFLRDINGLPSGANPSPLTTGDSRYQTYGRYTARLKADAGLSNYHAAWLLWPELDSNGACAESDFPEGGLSSTVTAFVHNDLLCSNYSNQEAYRTNTRFDSGWHTYTQEWSPGLRKYYIDDQLIGTSTTRIWDQPARWQLQTEPNGNTHASGHLMVDWVAAYAYQVQ